MSNLEIIHVSDDEYGDWDSAAEEDLLGEDSGKLLASGPVLSPTPMSNAALLQSNSLTVAEKPPSSSTSSEMCPVSS